MKEAQSQTQNEKNIQRIHQSTPEGQEATAFMLVLL